MSRSPRYTGVAIALHWAIALLIGFIIWLGWNIDDHEARFQLHKSIGITILFLTVARIVWRGMNPPPALPDEMKPLEKRASHWVHMAFYALLVLVPLAGWLMVSVSPFNVPTVLYGTISWPKLPFTSGLRGEDFYSIIEFMHSKSAWVFISLLALHVLGALKHEFSEEDGVLKRMIPGLFGKTGGPSAPARGFIPAFGGALAIFAIIAVAPLLINASGSESAPAASNTQPKVASNWDVDYDTAEISFSGIHDGIPFSGTFENWTAEVAFYPNDLTRSNVWVEVDLSSAQTGKKLYDDSLSAAEWFDVKTNATATIALDNFRDDPETVWAIGDGYLADATLTLKGISTVVPLKFWILISEDNVATMGGETALKRTPLELGLVSDPTADWVSEDVSVSILGKATRTTP